MRSSSNNSVPSAPFADDEQTGNNNAYRGQGQLIVNYSGGGQQQGQQRQQGQQQRQQQPLVQQRHEHQPKSLSFGEHPAFQSEYVFARNNNQQNNAQNNNVNVPLQANDSYLGANFQYPDTSLYKNAALCVWRQNPNGKGIQFLMPVTATQNNNNNNNNFSQSQSQSCSQTLNFFNITRNQNDKNAIQTALRGLQRQCGNKLSDDILAQLGQSWTADKDRKLFWKKEWSSVLFFYNMSYDYGISGEEDNSKRKRPSSCHWISFDKVYRCVCITGNPVFIKKEKYPCLGFLVGMFLQRQVRQYLELLHIKSAGLKIRPKNGGVIRSALTHFDNISKVIRCDFIHPVTHQVMFHRWLETDILRMEDQLIFMSLVSSLFPEIGQNFRAFYTYGDPYKAAKNGKNNGRGCKLEIDSNPGFVKLQKEIRHRGNAHFSTVISILPTFVISSNFANTGVCFNSFKKQHISWMDEIYSNGNGNQNQNQNNSFSHMFKNWQPFSGNSSSNNNNNNQSTFYSNNSKPSTRVLDYKKWQYQEDNQSWTDYEKAVSKQINSFQVSHSQRHYSHHQSSMNIPFAYSSLQLRIKNNDYQIDVYFNQQKRISTSKVRAIRQIPVYKFSGAIHRANANSNEYVWQFEDDGINNWTDYKPHESRDIESRYVASPYTSFLMNAQNKNNITTRYQIALASLKQTNMQTKKIRNIRRIYGSANNSGSVSAHHYGGGRGNNGSDGSSKHKWEWLDEHNKWCPYNKKISIEVDNAFRNGFKKYFFTNSGLAQNKKRRHQAVVHNNNNNSYEISFNTFKQLNVQSGKERCVRKIALVPKWNFPGNDPNAWLGPVQRGSNNNNNGANARHSRRTFGDKVMTLYCVVGKQRADLMAQCRKFVEGNTGPFGCGLYFVESMTLAKNMARSRTFDNKGYLVTARVFVGKENDLSQSMDRNFDFQSMQSAGFDSIKRKISNGVWEHIVYSYDQVCIVTVQQY